MTVASTRRSAVLVFALGSACSGDEGSDGVETTPSIACEPAAPSGTEPAAVAGAPDTSSIEPGARPLDLLFVIDNSRSMADKQQLLQKVADVLDRFVHPACVDAEGNQFPSPAAGEACAEGQRLQFEPVTDMHLGVITTSLGDGGANVACPSGPELPTFTDDGVNDMAHLLGALPRGRASGANADGFVSWRAGEPEDSATEQFGRLLTAAGEVGCGWEMPLEAWYRFLVDPHPYASLTRAQCPGSPSTSANCVVPAGCESGGFLVDEVLLAQRQAFLRPNSRLGIVMLTDENDCSLAVGGQSWTVLAINDSRPYFRGSGACDTNANDPCCYSCPLGPPEGCRADPVCAADAASGGLQNRLPQTADGASLRCFQQQRRFGIDMLYPVERYVNALTQPLLCPSANDLAVAGCRQAVVPNPLFSSGRAPSDVFLAGIVGVPPELLEANENVAGRPAIENGFRYKLASELDAGDWMAMLGDSNASPPLEPTSPFMIESPLPRPGVGAANPINGREYQTAFRDTPDDLQYACIFPLPEPRDCDALDPNVSSCDCYDGSRDTPLCEAQPGVTEAGSVQYWGKAYPSTRQLEVLRRLGERALVSSICARNSADVTASNFSYRPALAALIDSMERSLSRP